MKIISTVLLTLGIGTALMSASVSPTAAKEAVSASAIRSQEIGGAIKIIAPQKDLETAIRSSEKGDILLYGPEGWYRLEGKALQQGTKMYVLGSEGSIVSAFPKEADSAR